MEDLVSQFTVARKRGWFRDRPVLEECRPASSVELVALEKAVGCALPGDLRVWLETVGFCNVNDELSIREFWFKRVDVGHLKGAFLFAQDDLGNFYGMTSPEGQVLFFSRSEAAYAVLASSFREFLRQLAGREYVLADWVDNLKLAPYDWNAV